MFWSSWSDLVSRTSMKILRAAHEKDDASLSIAVEELCQLPVMSLRRPHRRGQKGIVQLRHQLDNPALPGSEPFVKERSSNNRISFALKCVRNGKPGKAARALLSAPVLRASSATTKALTALHPPPLQDNEACTYSPGAQFLDPLLVKEVVRQSRTGSARGPSGWTAELLHPCLDDDTNLEAFCLLFSRLISGTLPLETRQTLTASRLIALDKGEGKVRPIAIGELFYRLSAKLALRLHKDQIAKALEKHQYGVGKPGGMEIITHSISYILQENPDLTCLQLDFTNAFNSIERSVVLDVVRERLPALYPFVCWSYSCEALLYHEDHTLFSRNGVRQGDPLGPLLFSLGLQPVLESVGSRHDCLIFAFLDDVYLVGNAEDLEEARCELVEQASIVSLQFNALKSNAFSPQDCSENPFPCSLTGEGMVVLGSPVGNREFCEDFLESALAEHKTVFDELEPMPSQEAYLLLRFCMVPKVIHLSRLVPSHLFRAFGRRFDRMMLD